MNDNKKDGKIPTPAPAEIIEIPQAINIALLTEKTGEEKPD